MDDERKKMEEDENYDVYMLNTALSKIKNKVVVFVYYNGHGGVDVDRDKEDEFTAKEKKELEEQKVERSTYGYTIQNEKIFLDKWMKDL